MIHLLYDYSQGSSRCQGQDTGSPVLQASAGKAVLALGPFTLALNRQVAQRLSLQSCNRITDSATVPGAQQVLGIGLGRRDRQQNKVAVLKELP